MLLHVTATAGTAAYNIGGTTIHAAFHLPRGNFYSLKANLSPFALPRAQLSQMNILVIDEISTVGRITIFHIRLNNFLSRLSVRESLDVSAFLDDSGMYQLHTTL